MKKFASGVLASLLLFTGGGIVNSEAFFNSNEKVKNIVFLIPDGYSAAYATNYRLFKGSNTLMDSALVGMIKTSSANSEVTDSAAAGTALATGFKTNNGMISVTPDGKVLPTILEASREAGKATGLVATSTITHATPAVFASHDPSRGAEEKLAPQLLERVDVLLGGGLNKFLPKDLGGGQEQRNLVQEAKEKGYKFVENGEQLKQVQGDKILGLFAKEGMAPEIDRDQTKEPSLAEMTEKALDTLSKDKDGFFLMVEGSQIDWAGHAHDAAWAMKDVEAFEAAVQKAMDFAKKDGKTLVVVVGDHDTGGMSVGGYGQYDAKLEVLHNVTASCNVMAGELNKEGTNVGEVIKKYTGFELTAGEISQFQTALKNKVKPNVALGELISQRALVGWTSVAHTGVDVPIYAYGPGADKLSGLHDNTDLPKIFAQAMRIQF